MSKSVNKMKASFENILSENALKLGDTVTLRQVKSTIGKPKDQKDTIKCLGFKTVYDSVSMKLTLDALGRINKVSHLLEFKKSA